MAQINWEQIARMLPKTILRATYDYESILNIIMCFRDEICDQKRKF